MLSGLNFVSHQGKDKKHKKKKKEKKDKKKKRKSEKTKSKRSPEQSSSDTDQHECQTQAERSRSQEFVKQDKVEDPLPQPHSAPKEPDNDSQPEPDKDSAQRPEEKVDQMDNILGLIVGKSGSTQNQVAQQRDDQTESEQAQKTEQRYGLNVKLNTQQVSRNVVGDGGMSYRLKMYERMKERAQETGIPVEVEIAQRFGDVEKFMELIKAAEEQNVADQPHLQAARDRRRQLRRSDPKHKDHVSKADYLRKDKSEVMKKPAEFQGRTQIKRTQDRENNEYRRRSQRQSKSNEDAFSTTPDFSKKNALPQQRNVRSDKNGDDAAQTNLNAFVNDGSFMRQFEQEIGDEPQPPQEDKELGQQTNLSMAQRLKRRLQVLKNPRSQDEIEPEPEALPQIIDASGRPVPGAFGRQTQLDYQRQQSRDDIRQTLKRMKYGEADFEDKQTPQFGSGPSRIEDEDDFKEMEMNRTKRRKKLNMEQMENKERSKEIRQQRRWQTVYDKCKKCMGGPAREPLKHLTVAIGQFSYLSLPSIQELVEGQCEIIPVEHLPSMRQVDDAVWTEIRNFKKALIMMFKKQGKEVVFMETALRVKGDFQKHACVQAIPMDQDSFSRARFFFKKALEEAESEWSTHHAKRVIDTRAKGLRGSIPAGFPYFHVEFGIEGGFVHVVDDQRKFNEHLGRQTIVGLLRLPEDRMYSRDYREDVYVQKGKVAKFLQMWEPYDWTRQLDE